MQAKIENFFNMKLLNLLETGLKKAHLKVENMLKNYTGKFFLNFFCL